jgi:hypothetical protein
VFPLKNKLRLVAGKGRPVLRRPMLAQLRTSGLLTFPGTSSKMDIHTAIAELKHERDLIAQAIVALELLNEKRHPPSRVDRPQLVPGTYPRLT